jgi:hypothetical protein
MTESGVGTVRLCAIDSGRTDVDDKQRSGSPGTSTTNGKVFSADGLIRADGNLNWADTDRMLGSSPSSKHRIVQDQRDYGKECACVRAQAERQRTS